MTTALQNGSICGPAGIYTPAVLQTLLKHERCRADREDGKFSLVVFDVIGMLGNDGGIRQIVACIRKKTRSIDEIGWLDEKRIGVLLPLADATGGERFAERVGESFTGRFSLIPWSVYSYPTHWTPGSERKEKRASAESSEHATNDTPASSEEALEDIFGDLFCRKIPVWKRVLDIMGSLFFIVILSPVFFITACFIPLVSPGKIFYKQKRVGYKGRLFTFLKFRTMHENNDPSAHKEYVKKLIRGDQKAMEKLDGGRDPRIIPGGRILRKMCVDELPQLFNVLFGSMSLVGPRPCILYEAEEYLRWHTHRFDILPGMTGLWQVSGKNKLSFEEMIRLDISYADTMSLFKDIAILVRTVPTIIGMVFEKTMKKLRKLGGKVAEQVPESFATSGIEGESVHNA